MGASSSAGPAWLGNQNEAGSSEDGTAVLSPAPTSIPLTRLASPLQPAPPHRLAPPPDDAKNGSFKESNNSAAPETHEAGAGSSPGSEVDLIKVLLETYHMHNTQSPSNEDGRVIAGEPHHGAEPDINTIPKPFFEEAPPMPVWASEPAAHAKTISSWLDPRDSADGRMVHIGSTWTDPANLPVAPVRLPPVEASDEISPISGCQDSGHGSENLAKEDSGPLDDAASGSLDSRTWTSPPASALGDASRMGLPPIRHAMPRVPKPEVHPGLTTEDMKLEICNRTVQVLKRRKGVCPVGEVHQEDSEIKHLAVLLAERDNNTARRGYFIKALESSAQGRFAFDRSSPTKVLLRLVQ